MHILKRSAAGCSLLVHFITHNLPNMGYISYSAHSHGQLFKNRQYDLAKNLPLMADFWNTVISCYFPLPSVHVGVPELCQCRHVLTDLGTGLVILYPQNSGLWTQTMTSQSVQLILQLQSPVLAGFKYQSAFLVAGSLVESATIAGWYPNILMANTFISALILSRFEPGSADPGDPRGVEEANGSWCRCHDHATEHPPTGWEQSRQRYLFRFLSAT